MALIVFHAKWTIPNRWIEAVINAEYEHGIVLHTQSYDVMENIEMNMPEYEKNAITSTRTLLLVLNISSPVTAPS